MLSRGLRPCAGIPRQCPRQCTDTARLVEVLRVTPGQVLADIGAGPEALLTIPMAEAVGPSGKVYATDMSQMLGRVRETIEKSGLKNIELLEGQPSATNLPPGCCDGIFIRNVYHHLADPPAMNASVWRSLKPGGRLAVIDFRPEGSEAASPAGRDSGDQHGVLPETSRELTPNRFYPGLVRGSPGQVVHCCRGKGGQVAPHPDGASKAGQGDEGGS